MRFGFETTVFAHISSSGFDLFSFSQLLPHMRLTLSHMLFLTSCLCLLTAPFSSCLWPRLFFLLPVSPISSFGTGSARRLVSFVDVRQFSLSFSGVVPLWRGVTRASPDLVVSGVRCLAARKSSGSGSGSSAARSATQQRVRVLDGLLIQIRNVLQRTVVFLL